MITVLIFSLLTSVVLSNYHDYNRNALFANATEDIALALRQAQVYGVGAKGNTMGSCGGISSFDCRYGVYFSISAPTNIFIFADVNDNYVFDGGDTTVESFLWKNSIEIKTLECGGLPCTNGNMSITFKRPNPQAFITDTTNINNVSYTSGQIVLTNGTRYSTTTISRAGQISVE